MKARQIFSISSTIISFPSVGGDSVFFYHMPCSNSPQVVLESRALPVGERQWKRELRMYPGCYWASGLPIGDSLITFDKGEVVRMAGATGEVLFRSGKRPRHWYACSPAAADDKQIFVATLGIYLTSIYKMSLRKNWSVSFGSGAIYSRPVVAGNRIFAIAHELDASRVAAVEIQSGELLWRRDFPGLDFVSAVDTGADGLLLLPAMPGPDLISLDQRSGEIRWKTSFGSSARVDPQSKIFDEDIQFERSALVAGSRLFHASVPGLIESRSCVTGRLIWQGDVGGVCLGSPMMLRDSVAVVTTNGKISFWDIDRGTCKDRLQLPGPVFSVSAIWRDQLVLLDSDGSGWLVA